MLSIYLKNGTQHFQPFIMYLENEFFSVGSNGLDHIYEMPVQKLDIVWSNKINDHIDLKIAADNILNRM